MTRVSIVIPTYNRSDRLLTAIESAKESAVDAEIVIVDDASTDDTALLCKDRSDLKYIRLRQNQKTGGSRNVGIAASSSKYVAFLDDDDRRLPGTLDKQLDLLDRNPEAGLCYGQYLSCDQDNNILDLPLVPSECAEGDIFWRLLEPHYLIGNSTAVARKDALLSIGMQDTSPAMYGIEDWDCWIRLAEIYPVVALHEPVAVYRVADEGSDQWCSNDEDQFLRVVNAYRKKWLKLPKAIRELDEEALAEMNREVAERFADLFLYRASKSDRIRQKVERIKTAVKLNPRLLSSGYFYKVAVRNFVFGPRTES